MLPRTVIAVVSVIVVVTLVLFLLSSLIIQSFVRALVNKHRWNSLNLKTKNHITVFRTFILIPGVKWKTANVTGREASQ